MANASSAQSALIAARIVDESRAGSQSGIALAIMKNSAGDTPKRADIRKAVGALSFFVEESRGKVSSP
jgi:hypothetical protein